MKNNVSAENYLETILVLGAHQQDVRSIDVARELNFSRASVSVAMKRLREQGHIEVTGEGFLLLTDSGRKIAETIYKRHKLIYVSLIRLGVDEKIAFRDACRMEHWLSPESYDALKHHIEEEEPDILADDTVI